MKKLFRMALVLVLAGSALVYTSCTKDYSPDIKSLQEQIDNLNNGPEGLAWLKTQLQGVQSSLTALEGKVNGEITNKINNLQTQLTNAIADLDANKADKAAFNALKTAFDELKDELMGEDGKIAEMEAAIEALQNGSDAIANQFSEYAKFIQSMAYVPATSNGLITVVPYYLTDTEDDSYEVENWVYLGNIHGWGRMNPDNWELVTTVIPRNADGTVSQSLLVASFKVTPSDAVSRVTKETASLVAVQTKAAAAAPDTLTITKLVARADAPGYVDVYAIPGKVKFDPNSFAVALAVTQVVGEGENPLEESVTSDYAPATIQQGAENIVFQIRDEKDGTIVNPTKNDDPVKVYPSSDPDSVNVFTAGRWSVVASFAGSYLTPEEAKEVFGLKKIELVSPKVGDTIVAAVEANPDYYAWKDYGFESTVWPAGEKKIKDLINSGNDEFQLALNIANSHMVGTTFTPSGKVIATYKATPDVKKLALTPEHPVVIPWDYANYNDIADTLIAKIWVAGDRNKLIGTGDAPLRKATKTWNKDTEIDYTQGVGAVTKHTNDSKAIDVVLVSSAEYGKADSTYVYSIQQYNAEEATMYVGEFDYVVEARPADVTVELGPVDTVVRFANDIEFDVEPIYRAIAAHAEAYAPFDTADVYPAFAAAVTNSNPKAGKATLDGKELKNYGAKLNIVYSDKPEDASTLKAKINKVGQYKIPFEYKVFGIKYTFVLTVNAANNPAKIAPKAAYVSVDDAETKDYSVEVKGDVDTTAGAANRWHYFLVEMPFQDYIKVVDYAEDSEVLKIAHEVVTEAAVGAVRVPGTPTDLDRLTEDPTVANLHNTRKFQWNDYDSLQFKVALVLYPDADATCQVDSATVRLWTADPIPVFDGGDMLVIDHFAAGVAQANIAANINMKDLNGVALTDSTGLRAIGWDAKAKEVVVDYDQALSYGDIKDFKLISGAQYIEELKLSWVDTGVLELRVNQGTIVEPIIIQVPVYLSHMLDRGMKEKNTAWVTVKFVEKGTAAAGE
jgi:hypothetical protein